MDLNASRLNLNFNADNDTYSNSAYTIRQNKARQQTSKNGRPLSCAVRRQIGLRQRAWSPLSLFDKEPETLKTATASKANLCGENYEQYKIAEQLLEEEQMNLIHQQLDQILQQAYQDGQQQLDPKTLLTKNSKTGTQKIENSALDSLLTKAKYDSKKNIVLAKNPLIIRKETVRNENNFKIDTIKAIAEVLSAHSMSDLSTLASKIPEKLLHEPKEVELQGTNYGDLTIQKDLNNSTLFSFLGYLQDFHSSQKQKTETSPCKQKNEKEETVQQKKMAKAPLDKGQITKRLMDQTKRRKWSSNGSRPSLNFQRKSIFSKQQSRYSTNYDVRSSHKRIPKFNLDSTTKSQLMDEKDDNQQLNSDIANLQIKEMCQTDQIPTQKSSIKENESKKKINSQIHSSESKSITLNQNECLRSEKYQSSVQLEAQPGACFRNSQFEAEALQSAPTPKDTIQVQGIQIAVDGQKIYKAGCTQESNDSVSKMFKLGDPSRETLQKGNVMTLAPDSIHQLQDEDQKYASSNSLCKSNSSAVGIKTNMSGQTSKFAKNKRPNNQPPQAAGFKEKRKRCQSAVLRNNQISCARSNIELCRKETQSQISLEIEGKHIISKEFSKPPSLENTLSRQELSIAKKFLLEKPTQKASKNPQPPSIVQSIINLESECVSPKINSEEYTPVEKDYLQLEKLNEHQTPQQQSLTQQSQLQPIDSIQKPNIMIYMQSMPSLSQSKERDLNFASVMHQNTLPKADPKKESFQRIGILLQSAQSQPAVNPQPINKDLTVLKSEAVQTSTNEYCINYSSVAKPLPAQASPKDVKLIFSLQIDDSNTMSIEKEKDKLLQCSSLKNQSSCKNDFTNTEFNLVSNKSTIKQPDNAVVPPSQFQAVKDLDLMGSRVESDMRARQIVSKTEIVPPKQSALATSNHHILFDPNSSNFKKGRAQSALQQRRNRYGRSRQMSGQIHTSIKKQNELMQKMRDEQHNGDPYQHLNITAQQPKQLSHANSRVFCFDQALNSSTKNQTASMVDTEAPTQFVISAVQNFQPFRSDMTSENKIIQSDMLYSPNEQQFFIDQIQELPAELTHKLRSKAYELQFEHEASTQPQPHQSVEIVGHKNLTKHCKGLSLVQYPKSFIEGQRQKVLSVAMTRGIGTRRSAAQLTRRKTSALYGINSKEFVVVKKKDSVFEPELEVVNSQAKILEQRRIQTNLDKLIQQQRQEKLTKKEPQTFESLKFGISTLGEGLSQAQASQQLNPDQIIKDCQKIQISDFMCKKLSKKASNSQREELRFRSATKQQQDQAFYMRQLNRGQNSTQFLHNRQSLIDNELKQIFMLDDLPITLNEKDPNSVRLCRHVNHINRGTLNSDIQFQINNQNSPMTQIDSHRIGKHHTMALAQASSSEPNSLVFMTASQQHQSHDFDKSQMMQVFQIKDAPNNQGAQFNANACRNALSTRRRSIVSRQKISEQKFKQQKNVRSGTQHIPKEDNVALPHTKKCYEVKGITTTTPLRQHNEKAEDASIRNSVKMSIHSIAQSIKSQRVSANDAESEKAGSIVVSIVEPHMMMRRGILPDSQPRTNYNTER